MAKERALKVPVPNFLIDRLRGNKAAFLLTGSQRDQLSGQRFLLINERLKKGEPTWAWGRVTFTLGRRINSTQQLTRSERESVDPVMLREFQTREGPLFLLKVNLVDAFARPKRLKSAPPGRFSSFVDLATDTIKESILLSSNDSNSSIESKIKHLPHIIERLKYAQVFDTNFRRIIAQNNSPDSFFFLNPPQTDLINADILESVRRIKGQFILSLPNTQSVNDMFNEFEIRKIENEILISNFPLQEVTVASGVHDAPHGPNGDHTHIGLPRGGSHEHADTAGEHWHREDDPLEGWHLNLEGDTGSHQHILALGKDNQKLLEWMKSIIDAHFPVHKWIPGHKQTWIQHIGKDDEPRLATEQDWMDHFGWMHSSGMHRFRHEKIFIDPDTQLIRKWYELEDGTKREVTSEDFQAEEVWMAENIPFPRDFFQNMSAHDDEDKKTKKYDVKEVTT